MARQYVKDFYNRVIGSLDDTGDEIIARDFYNRVLGYYRKKENVTQDFYRRVVGKGNLLSGLIWSSYEKTKGK